MRKYVVILVLTTMASMLPLFFVAGDTDHFGIAPTIGKIVASGDTFIDKMRSLYDKINNFYNGVDASDGTNCMNAISIAYQGTDLEGIVNTEDALRAAKASDQFIVLDSNGYSSDGRFYGTDIEGAIAIVHNDGQQVNEHAVMITENGGTIQSGSHGGIDGRGGIEESAMNHKDMFDYVDSYIVYVGAGGLGQ